MNKPNIILIITEGQAASSFGFAGDPYAQTPNIDALAAHGVRFTRASTQSLDVDEARECLLTGTYRGGTSSFARAFHDAGYTTSFIGAAPDGLMKDYDVVRRVPHGDSAMGATEYEKYLDGVGIKLPQTSNIDAHALRSPLPQDHHPIAWIGSQAVRSVQQLVSPFLIVLSIPRPRPPYDPPVPWNTRCDVDEGPKEIARARSHYYGQSAFIDQQVGRLMATLSARGISQSIMVYTALHGDALGEGGAFGVDPSKPRDSAIGVPIVFAGAPGQRRSVAIADPIESVDIAPTLLSLCGVAVPKTIHGRSLADQLAQARKATRDGAITMLPDGEVAWRDEKGILICDSEGAPVTFLPAPGADVHVTGAGGNLPPAVALRLRRISAVRERFGI